MCWSYLQQLVAECDVPVVTSVFFSKYMHGSWIKCCYEILYKVLFVEVYKAIYSIYDMLRYQWSLLAMCTLKKKTYGKCILDFKEVDLAPCN